ncbi:class I SAM-dependent methyltransferase [Aestuariivivens sediminis]|uniref:class I SAM-dependent methyltransferase n=1 Tax=Aestuariivivens sediminis TaxID=2913557 RepID=UPI001F5AA7AC|nr:class I SAM-dependent methyltransferase [Aestuariivivens sediminis]
MENSFDAVAVDYDQSFTKSQIGKFQREMVYSYVLNFIPRNTKLRILEINCGTGEDAIWFAEQGHEVLATDISPVMLDMAKIKTKLKNLRFQQLDIKAIDQLSPEKKYDILFSNFGGLNCLSPSELKQFYQTSRKLLKDDGKMIHIIMSKCCIWDNIYLFFKGKWKSLFRRNTTNPVAVNINGCSIRTWYYNPSDIVSYTRDVFNLETYYPIGFCIPPSYLEHFFSKKKSVLLLLVWLDRHLQFSIISKYADHFIISLKAK